MLKERLHGLKARVPQIAEVRGLGSMVAIEFNKPGTHEPDPDFANQVRLRAQQKGLLLLTCGVYGNVIRFLYPLTIPSAVMDEALDILEGALKG